MYTPFPLLPPHARVWIYQASRELTPAEAAAIEQQAQAFAQGWVAHGSPLQTSAQVRHRHFLILAVDEQVNDASGCSIDSSVRFVRELEKAYGLSFFERTKLAFLQNGQVQLLPQSALNEAIENGHITAETSYFNNLVQTKKELDEAWLQPAGTSWLKRYFPAEAKKS